MGRRQQIAIGVVILVFIIFFSTLYFRARRRATPAPEAVKVEEVQPHPLTKEELDSSIQKQGDWLKDEIGGVNTRVDDLTTKVEDHGKKIASLQSTVGQLSKPRPARPAATAPAPQVAPPAPAQTQVSPSPVPEERPLTMAALRRRKDCP